MELIDIAKTHAPDLLLVGTLLVCCYIDLRRQKIYNAVLLPAVLAAFAISYLNGGAAGCLDSLKGLLVGMALLFLPFAVGGIGAGDVKLLGAIGAFKGPEFVLVAFLAGAVAGGAISVFLLIKQGKLLLTFKKIYYFIINKIMRIPVSLSFRNLEVAAKGESFPYALVIGLGTMLAYILG